MKLPYEIKIEGDWESGRAMLKKLGDPNEAKYAMGMALSRVSSLAAAALREILRSGRGVEPLSSGTLAKRLWGKAKGTVNDPIKAWGGRKPLYRSGALANSVFTVQASQDRYEVGFAEGVFGPYAGGRAMPIAEIAQKLEFGFQITQPITRYMMTYLRVLAGDNIEPKPGAENYTYFSRVLRVTIPARPFFTRAFNSIVKPAKDWFVDRYCEVLGVTE